MGHEQPAFPSQEQGFQHRAAQEAAHVTQHLAETLSGQPSELTRVVTAWLELSGAIRAAILATIEAATSEKF
jgi:hypothetical protein